MILLAALNWHTLAFFGVALVAIAFAVAVVLTSNIVRMAFYLTLCLSATSGLFFLAGSEFIGSMQLMIYVGGTLVLLVFGVMLTAQSRFISMQTSGAEWVLAAIVGGSLFLLLLQAAFSVPEWKTPNPDFGTLALATGKTSTPIGLALTGIRVDKLDEPSAELRRGMAGYLFPFVIVSMHLLVVLIGAAYMARSKRLGSGPRVDHAATVMPATRIRSTAVTMGIISGIVVNLVLGLACLAYFFAPTAKAGEERAMASVLGYADTYLEPAADWLCLALGALFLLNVLLLVVVYNWQRWGVITLVLTTVVQAVAIGNAGIPAWVAAVFFVLAIAPVVLLIGLLTAGRQPTMWEQME